MSDLIQRKQKFLEVLLTLGSLLAVFLGLVVGSKPIFLNALVVFGLMFAVSVLTTYTVFLFPEWIHGRGRFWAILLPRIGVALSFALMITLGVLYIISEVNFPISGILMYVEGMIITAVFLLSFYGNLILIFSVMNLTIARAEEP
ncbi:MAG: hypothetical protein JRN12_03455 [Nitrososphaerota archaeon]|nr:hypothetical protein [Nitrososphaerota archaeon]